MDRDAADRSPKTLADVSHLFFSHPEERSNSTSSADTGSQQSDSDAHGGASPPASQDACQGDAAAVSRGPLDRTGIVIVTGGDDRPGKSTVAANLSQALVRFGRVALLDVDPRLPNVRFYLGFASWNYLSPLTGGGEAAPNTATESGLVVVDRSSASREAIASLGSGDVVYLDAPAVGRRPVDFLVVDAPMSRLPLVSSLAGRSAVHIVVARPGRSGFESSFAAMKAIARISEPGTAELVVNMSPDYHYAERFHAKIAQATERLLSTRTELMGGVPVEAGMAGEQRERGLVVATKPDSPASLSLRQLASRAVDLARGGSAVEEPHPTNQQEEQK